MLDISAIIEALRNRALQATDAYMQTVGNPARQFIGGSVRGYLGLDAPEYADSTGMETYRNAQALSNTPVLGAPAGAVKAMAAAPLIVKSLRAAPRSEALETARKNAVKMLGLPENNTPMDRAKALGFNVDAYHAADADIKSFEPALLGANTAAKSAKEGIFAAKHPRTTYEYIENLPVDDLHEFGRQNMSNIGRLDRFMNNVLDHRPTPARWEAFDKAKDAMEEAQALRSLHIRALQKSLRKFEDDFHLEAYNKLKEFKNSGANIMSMKLRMDNPLVHDFGGSAYRDVSYYDLMKKAKEEGKDGVKFLNTKDGPKQLDDIYAVFDPSRVRSRFAAFDPARVNENDLLGRADPALLAALAGGTAATAATVSALRDKKKPE